MRAIASKLSKKLKPEDTAERCGLVLKSGKIVAIENSHPQPDKGFMIPISALHKYRESVVGTWHTHPNQSAAPSQDDYMGFANWPSLTHYIVGTDGVRAFVSDEYGILEEQPCS